MSSSSSYRTAGLDAHDVGVAVAMNLLWGLNIIAAKMAVTATAPFTAGAIRLLIVFIVCLPFARIVPGRTRTLLMLGLLSGGLFIATINLSLMVTENVAALAIAGQLGVPFSLLLAILFLGERVALPRLAGIAFTFLGVVLLVFDPAAAGEIPGLLITAIGSLIWATGSLLQRRLVGVPVLTILGWIGGIGALTLLPLAAWLEPNTFARLPELPLRDLGWLLFSAIGSTIIGHGGMAWLLQRHPVSTVAPLTLGAPVIAVIASSLFFGTVLTPIMITGGLITMTGVAIITFRSARKSGEKVA